VHQAVRILEEGRHAAQAGLGIKRETAEIEARRLGCSEDPGQRTYPWAEEEGVTFQGDAV
jgi:hypothetical protein